MGLLLAVVVTAASVQDRDGARLVAQRLGDRFPHLRHFWADGAYGGELVAWFLSFASWVLEVVKKPEGQKGFVVLPRRWVVERTFAWLGNYRRLSKDYEYEPRYSEAMIQLAMIHIMLKRLAKT